MVKSGKAEIKGGKERKNAYFQRLMKVCNEYPQIIVVNADNVGSNQLANVRNQLRAKDSVVLFGKNTMMRKAIRMNTAATGNNKLEKLLPYIKGNMGFILCKSDLKEVRDVINKNKVGAPARPGQVSAVNVIVPAGNTGMEPTKTSFFQALNIPTKITRGTVEIINDFHLLKVGDRVGNSEATLLQMMNIKPFAYQLQIQAIYDNGSMYEPKILDIADEDLKTSVSAAISNIAALSLAISLPNAASVPHMVANGFKNLLAIAVSTDYSFKQADNIKAYLADPSKFASAAPAASASSAAAPAAAAAPAKEEPKEESDGDMGLGLFD